MMRDRLLQIRELLALDGSVWVHLDDTEVHRARCMLDKVFGPENFVATIVWEKTTSARNDAHHFSVDQDYIVVYAKEKTLFSPNGLTRTASADAAYRNPDEDLRGPWREGDYKCGKTADERPNLYYPLTHPVSGNEVWPPRTSVWRYSKEEHQRHVNENLLWWGSTGNYRFPKIKRFRSTVSDTSVPRTLWMADEVDQTRRAKQAIQALLPGITPFATPKPERLLHRIISIATNAGDVVLDPFVGSGTTAAVAHKMGRRWVAVEREADTVSNTHCPG